MGHISKTERDGYRVERTIGKRQILGVNLQIVDVANYAFVGEPSPTLLKHVRIDVCAKDGAFVSHALS